MKLWNEYPLTMRFTVEVCGTVPKSKDIIDTWIAQRRATDAKHKKLQEGIGPEGKMPRPMDEVTKEVMEAALDEEAEKSWVGFMKDETGLFVRGGSVRAHLKSCADVLGNGMKQGEWKENGFPAIANFRAKMVDQVYIKEDRVYLVNPETGKPYQEPTGSREATMTVMTPLGPRTCLKRVDYVFPCELTCTVQLLPTRGITRDHLALLIEYGKVQGFNGDRSLQFGRYQDEIGEAK